MGKSEYDYRGNEHEVSHGYLYPVIIKLVGKIPPGSIVLDLGCGNGSFLSMFKQQGWQRHGTDFSVSGISLAKQHYPDINFFVADAQSCVPEIMQQCGPVDLILSTEVIEHLYDPRGFLATAFKVLKPGGTLVITTPYHGYIKNIMLAVVGKLDGHFTVTWDHGHIKFWSRKTLTFVLEEAGFKIEKFEGSGRFPYLWKSMVITARRPI
jgi:2-polyprenyl-3-methyl-5-hydroxy-6-metoxy-1,4-benzoquinol methylase